MPLSTLAVGRADKSSRWQLPASERSSDKLQIYRSDPVFPMTPFSLPFSLYSDWIEGRASIAFYKNRTSGSVCYFERHLS